MSVSNGSISSKTCEERDDFNHEIVKFPVWKEVSIAPHITMYTRDIRNELLIGLYLDIHVEHDKIQYIRFLCLFKVYTAVYK